jgi:hypothetical protein
MTVISSFGAVAQEMSMAIAMMGKLRFMLSAYHL